MNVLVAPCGFKESLSADEAVEAMTRGVLAADPTAHVLKAPMVDGGEGFTTAVVRAVGGRLVALPLTGPTGRRVQAHFGLVDLGQGTTGVLEIASAAGLRLVPRGERDPRRTTSFGVGELIAAALDAGAERLLIGCGDSGVSDGGAGMAQALGVELLDERGRRIGPGGSELARLRQIDLSSSRLYGRQLPIDVAVNWHNMLTGPRGVARVFGPQKGATPEAVAELELALENYARVVHQTLGLDVANMQGGGASGGLGAGFAAFLGARLHPRYELVMRFLEFERLLQRADLVLTAEGQLDEQTPHGKVPAEVARRAKAHGLPVLVLAGSLGQQAGLNLNHGVDAYFSIVDGPRGLDSCLQEARELLERATEHATRTFCIGSAIGSRSSQARCSGC